MTAHSPPHSPPHAHAHAHAHDAAGAVELDDSADMFGPHFHGVLFIIGCLVIAWYALRVCFFLGRHVMAPCVFYSQVSRERFQSKYGPRSWAVVTGGSDGIGREFCLQLAERGFRVIAIARSEEKLQRVVSEIDRAAGAPGTGAYICFDFSVTGEEADAAYAELFRKIDRVVADNRLTIEDDFDGMTGGPGAPGGAPKMVAGLGYIPDQDKVYRLPGNAAAPVEKGSSLREGGEGEGGTAAQAGGGALSTAADAAAAAVAGANNNGVPISSEQVRLDEDANCLSLLVNNVGIHYDHCEYFDEADPALNDRMLRVNCEAQLRMTYHFYTNVFPTRVRVRSSPYCCGILDMSSVSGVIPIPLSAMYAGTKAFNGALSRSLALEARVFNDEQNAAWIGGTIDVLSVYPSYVATSMTHTDRATMSIANAADVVRGALQQLVLSDTATTPGALSHAPLAALLEIAPAEAVEWFMLRQNKTCREKGWIAPDVGPRMGSGGDQAGVTV